MNNNNVLEEFFIWEEKNSTEQKTKLENNGVKEEVISTNEIKNDLTQKDWKDITNPKEKLDVDGNIIASGSITSFGDYSDERLKDREGNIENPLDIVDKLQGFYYRPNKTANDLGIKGNKEI